MDICVCKGGIYLINAGPDFDKNQSPTEDDSNSKLIQIKFFSSDLEHHIIPRVHRGLKNMIFQE